MPITYEWRGRFESDEVKALHAAAFGARDATARERTWHFVDEVSLGWVTARDDAALVGFVNVIWDGLMHAWIQDVMVASAARRGGIGTRLVGEAREACTRAGCEWLHVDFATDLRPFYYRACGFTPTRAGILRLR